METDIIVIIIQTPRSLLGQTHDDRPVAFGKCGLELEIDPILEPRA